MGAIDSFTQKTEAATKARSKEIRVPVQEAQILVMELSRLLKRENDLLERLDKVKDTPAKSVPTEQPTGDIVMDGGTFKK